ncbi:unnamed protein product [Cuscuta epithymum]|uniref:Uncharacterized protein n=1 Tax=Cuscuta epithymum TaxID=186058 RepID=A0AAV0CP34_9ASTE|nr:unnamed protein product [Cuscuta epithymum]
MSKPLSIEKLQKQQNIEKSIFKKSSEIDFENVFKQILILIFQKSKNIVENRSAKPKISKNQFFKMGGFSREISFADPKNAEKSNLFHASALIPHVDPYF